MEKQVSLSALAPLRQNYYNILCISRTCVREKVLVKTSVWFGPICKGSNLTQISSIYAIGQVLPGRNTFLSTFEESPSVPEREKHTEKSCNKVDPLWVEAEREHCHTTNMK